MAADNDYPETLAPAVEAARIAREYGSEPRQRFRTDGGLDVVVMKRGRLMLYVIDDGGTSTLRQTHPPVWRRVWSRRIFIAAGVALVFGFIGPFLVVGIVTALGFGPIDLDRANGWSYFAGTAMGAGFGGAILLLFIGVFIDGNHNVLDGLAAAKWDSAEWYEIPNVVGPSPGTRAQLDASERLAAKHEREAFVRRLPDGTAELVAASDGRVFRYVIGSGGEVRLVTRSDARLRHYVGLGFLVLAALALVSLFAAVFAGFVDHPVLWLFGAMSFLSMLVGHALHVDRRAARLARPREDWLEIRLPKPSD